MRINVLQHTPNEGPGTIRDWSRARGHELWVYHPETFGHLPSADETDLLVILGGPMSPNDDLPWIHAERELISQLLRQGKPLFGACFGAQQIAKVLGAPVTKAPHKEVGWAPVYRQCDAIAGIPQKLTALHWHEEMFGIPEGARLLFSSDLVRNQGFIYRGNVVGLQFHFEPGPDEVREIACNDTAYPLSHNDLHQTTADILAHPVPAENTAVMAAILDHITDPASQG
jgi:GMP synthase-like glutamine amidotransferase